MSVATTQRIKEWSKVSMMVSLFSTVTVITVRICVIELVLDIAFILTTRVIIVMYYSSLKYMYMYMYMYVCAHY